MSLSAPASPSCDAITVKRDQITDAAASAFANSGQQIPEKYIRTDEVLDGAVVGEDERYELPVVDMARLLDPELSALETEKLGNACRNWGFFQLANRGVDDAVVRRTKDNNRAVLQPAAARQGGNGDPRNRLRRVWAPLQQCIKW
ncbi:hypothetical protein BS78_01G312000 [Paspalum vaginatum]|nr:hypothetical protein BS78_01G312000 [Paspalum vaginatum]